MDGPLVEGDAVTFLPSVAELKPGNRTHHVRLDIVAQDIEIAPGVRYQAWTFGGSVPGPVIHVREGDRVNFVMRNRSHEKNLDDVPLPGAMRRSSSSSRPRACRGGPVYSCRCTTPWTFMRRQWRPTTSGA